METIKRKPQSVYKQTVIAYLLLLYFLLIPFYIFPSGLPQIADFLLLMIFFLLVLSQRSIQLGPVTRSTIGLFIAFILITIIVNGIWAIRLNDAWVLESASYYVYNSVIVLTFIIAKSLFGAKLYPLIMNAAAASLILQALLLVPMYGTGDGARETLFFNNPNQLGYYALVSLAIVLLINETGRRKKGAFFFLALISGSIVIMASLSKAAIFAAVLLFFGYGVLQLNKLARKNSLKMLALFSSFAIFLGIFMLTDTLDGYAFFDDLSLRLESTGGTEDDNLSGRGYDRIFNHPEYALIGAGEGDITGRITSDYTGELHSTIGTVLFSYGVIGFVLFSGLLLKGVVAAAPAHLFALLPVLFYGLTHNGLRSGLFWILLTLLIVLKDDAVIERRKKRDQTENLRHLHREKRRNDDRSYAHEPNVTDFPAVGADRDRRRINRPYPGHYPELSADGTADPRFLYRRYRPRRSAQPRRSAR
ncbi:O-antigen ligase [Salisediminibacterium halotolerans]|uniref:O-antigen ligase n=1 Tax=Salisediminibacterium halotolerans TaxID=517425 RepID=A0A1H9QIX8_9BACI|nr:O-antigen ligase [Salisediminibacterium haloalkalitolerans]